MTAIDREADWTEAWERAYNLWSEELYAENRPITRGEFRERLSPLLLALVPEPAEDERGALGNIRAALTPEASQ